MRKNTVSKPFYHYAIAEMEARSWICNEDGIGFNQPYNDINPHKRIFATIEQLHLSQSPLEEFASGLELPFYERQSKTCTTYASMQLPGSDIILSGQLEIGPRRGIVRHTLKAILEYGFELDDDHICCPSGRFSYCPKTYREKGYFLMNLEKPRLYLLKFLEREQDLNKLYMKLWEKNLKLNETKMVYKIP